MTKHRLREVLKKCDVCRRRDRSMVKTNLFVETSGPGEKLGFDIMQAGKEQLVIVAVDYFTRKAFAKMLVTKEASKVVKFLDRVFREFPFNAMLTDNGREFKNAKVAEWAALHNVKQEFAVPYYPESNGQVERLNRTIKAALGKTKGSLKAKLGKVVDAYNGTRHRAVGMSPNEAIKEENTGRVKMAQDHYRGEFKSRGKIEELEIGQLVLIRNEHKRAKSNDECGGSGKVMEKLLNNIYLVQPEGGEAI